MARFVEDCSRNTLFVAGSLDSLLPVNAVGRVVHAALAGLDFTAFDEAYANDAMGRPAVDPRRLAAVWIVALLRGVTSSVALTRLCGRDIEFRWLLGNAAVQKSTLCDFRKRHVEALTELSTQLLAAMARSGQLPGRELVLDGTIVDAASSCQANVTRKRLKKRMKRLQEIIAEKLADPEESAEAAGHIQARVAKLSDALEEMDRMGLMKEESRITLTEPEASMKKGKHGGYGPSHNVQAVTDAQSGAIVHVDVVAQGNDQGQLGPQIAQAIETLEHVAAHTGTAPGPVERIAADAAYHDANQLAQLEAQKIQTAVPNGQAHRRVPGQDEAHRAGAFSHDVETNTLSCPAGETLKPIGYNQNKTSEKYRAAAAVCNACPEKRRCCPNTKSGRTVHHSLHPELLARIEDYLQTPGGERMGHARQATGEGTFARLIGLLTWKRCRTWGRRGAQAEALWRQITHNLMLLTGQWRPLVLKP